MPFAVKFWPCGGLANQTPRNSPCPHSLDNQIPETVPEQRMSGVMIDHNAWVMVGDGQKALFFRNAGDATYPNLEIVQVLQQDNPSTSEQSSDRPGRTHSSNGTARSAMQETNWHKLEKHRFAMNIADAPYSAAHSGRYDKLVTAAPHPPPDDHGGTCARRYARSCPTRSWPRCRRTSPTCRHTKLKKSLGGITNKGAAQ